MLLKRLKFKVGKSSIIIIIARQPNEQRTSKGNERKLQIVNCNLPLPLSPFISYFAILAVSPIFFVMLLLLSLILFLSTCEFEGQLVMCFSSSGFPENRERETGIENCFFLLQKTCFLSLNLFLV